MATVTTEDFVPGTLVAFHTFQRHNPWFRGDYVVIHNGLSEAACNTISTLFDCVRFHSVSDELSGRIQRLADARTKVASHQAQFYSFEAFTLTDYAKVLFCDSDVLFRGSFAELWDCGELLVCCRDRRGYLGSDTLNSGMMLIDAELVNESEYCGLLDLLTPEMWDQDVAAHADQFTLNQRFAGRCHLVNATYNYLLKHPGVMDQYAGVNAADAGMLHFNTSVKPWQTDRMVHFDFGTPVVADAFQWWNEAFIECLKVSFLRRMVSTLATGRSEPKG